MPKPRCVRRAFCVAQITIPATSYELRRQLIEDNLLELADVFAIAICAYAIMSNHYHVVLLIDIEQADNWNQKEVIYRWYNLFTGNLLSLRLVRGEAMSQPK